MEGHRVEPGRLLHPLGSAAGRRGKGDRHLARGQDLEDRVDQRRLADPGAAGDDAEFRDECEAQRGYLAFGQGQSGTLLDPRDRLVGVNRTPRQSACLQPMQPLGNSLLGTVEACKKDHLPAVGHAGENLS